MPFRITWRSLRKGETPGLALCGKGRKTEKPGWGVGGGKRTKERELWIAGGTGTIRQTARDFLLSQRVAD